MKIINIINANIENIINPVTTYNKKDIPINIAIDISSIKAFFNIFKILVMSQR